MDDRLALKPIGFIQTSSHVRFHAPHQPRDGIEEQNLILLDDDPRLEIALQDLHGFDRIWLLWWSHRNSGWRPKVLPPRGENRRRGVFATRSPHRPNPICLTAVRLISIEGPRVTVGNCDLLDGTPILDIKPYVPKIDAFPSSRAGWVDDIDRMFDNPPDYQVRLGPFAREQLDWLAEDWGVEILPRASEILSRDPRPHRTRRISQQKDGRFRIGCGPWRLVYRIVGMQIEVDEVLRGYSTAALESSVAFQIPDCEAQRAFALRWPRSVARTQRVN